MQKTCILVSIENEQSVPWLTEILRDSQAIGVKLPLIMGLGRYRIKKFMGADESET